MKEKTRKELTYLVENNMLTTGEMKRLYMLVKDLDEYAESLTDKYRPTKEQRDVKRVRQFMIRIHPDE